MMIQKLIALDWMSSYHTRLKQYLGNTYYDRSEIDTLISDIEPENVLTIYGTMDEINSMDISKYPNGTIVVVEE